MQYGNDIGVSYGNTHLMPNLSTLPIYTQHGTSDCSPTSSSDCCLDCGIHVFQFCNDDTVTLTTLKFVWASGCVHPQCLADSVFFLIRYAGYVTPKNMYVYHNK